MIKKAILRGLCSYCICVAISNILALIVLSATGQTTIPHFAAKFATPMTAAILQCLFISLIGLAFGASSVIFEIERWSFLRQGAVHFAVTAAVWIIVETICFSPMDPALILSMGVSLAATYAVTWGAQYLSWRRQVRALDEQIRLRKEEDPS